jgi:hypothetical protein
MGTIRAHFDGKVFVPDEPVDLPLNTPVQVTPSDDLEPPTSEPDQNPTSLTTLVTPPWIGLPGS